MIPRTAGQGHSFKGAGLYFLHDKQADTKDRVVWTHTHNLPTQDAEKAMKVMAFTAMNAEYYKDKVGGSKAGRKATRGPVFTFSLAWHPEQNPDEQHMKKTAFSALKKLGLDKDHQSVILAHNDTDHPHVHVIANLVSLKNGKRAKLSYDHLSLSTWAEEYERENGQKIYCEQRVKNNQERKKLREKEIKDPRRKLQQKFKEAVANKQPATKPKETGIVKHRDAKHERAALIQVLYRQSDSGKAFQAALKENGYTLTTGNRRSFTLVDERGKFYSLSRQMKGFWKKDKEGQWKSDLKEKLSDLELQNAQEVSKQNAQEWERNQHYDREQAKIDEENRMLDAADKAAQETAVNVQPEKQAKKTPEPEQEKPLPSDTHISDKETYVIEPYYKQYDRIKAVSDKADREREKFKERMAKSDSDRDERRRRVKSLQKKIAQSTIKDRLLGKQKEWQSELEAEEKSLGHDNRRITEQWGIFENRLAKEFPSERKDSITNDNTPKPSPVVDFAKEKAKAQEQQQSDEAEKERKREAFKARKRLKVQERKDLDRDKDAGFEMD